MPGLALPAGLPPFLPVVPIAAASVGRREANMLQGGPACSFPVSR